MDPTIPPMRGTKTGAAPSELPQWSFSAMDQVMSPAAQAVSARPPLAEYL